MINYKINDNNKYLPVEGGTLSGDLNMGGRLIKNVADPINDSDSITKKYVEENFATQEDFSAIGILLSMNNIATVKVVNSLNKPLKGIQVNGMVDGQGDTVLTDENGVASGICKNSTITLNLSPIDNITKDITSIRGTTNKLLITLPSIENKIVPITTSKSVQIAPITKTLDVCCIGGGGGGGGTLYYTYIHEYQIGGDETIHHEEIPYHFYGGGGGGGNITNSINVSFTPYTSYQAVIGAGGSGSYADGCSSYTGKPESSTSNDNGGSGGTTTFMNIKATGGGGGERGYNEPGYSNPTHLGKGGSSTNGGAGGDYGASGSSASLSIFNDGVTFYSGGGGGTSGSKSSNYGAGGSSGVTYSSTINANSIGNAGVVLLRLHEIT